MNIVQKLTVVLTVLLFSMQAQAAVVTYTLQDVTFEDGGTASGSFDFDTITMIFSNIEITTTAGTLFDGTTHMSQPPFASTSGLSFFVDSDATSVSGAPALAGATSLFLGVADGPVFTSLLPQLGLSSIIALELISEGTCINPSCTSASSIRVAESRFLVTDGLSEVPLPAALPLFLLGLASLKMRSK